MVVRHPPQAPWRQPYYWWGPAWAKADAVPLSDQIGRGVLTQSEANALCDVLLLGKPLIIAAPGSGCGKSSLLWSLVASLPNAIERIFIRGVTEPFDFVDHRHEGPRLLLVNELSPFLPTYCWGESARRTVNLIDTGFGFAATMHARNRADIASALSAIRIHDPRLELTCAELESGDARDRVNRVARLSTVIC